MVKNSRIPISLTELNRRRALAAQGLNYKEHDVFSAKEEKGLALYEVY